MAAEAVIRFAAMLAAAMTIVAVPASAQTNDPNPDQTKIDCRDGTNAAGADCAKDGSDTEGGSDAAQSGAVFLPALIVDLFPNPAAPPTPVPTPRPEPATPPGWETGRRSGPAGT
ncbi:peptidase S8, partial [Mesorhizobium sp. M7A.F.Ca.US.003.02.2.1]